LASLIPSPIFTFDLGSNKLLKQFDIVRIISAREIKFVSGPRGNPATPQGDWSVVGFVGSDVIITKDSTVVRAPLGSVKLIASYDVENYIKKKQLEKKDGEERQKGR
jgi:hypothetical protein